MIFIEGDAGCYSLRTSGFNEGDERRLSYYVQWEFRNTAEFIKIVSPSPPTSPINYLLLGWWGVLLFRGRIKYQLYV